jgi:HK97 family phage prohead protease
MNKETKVFNLELTSVEQNEGQGVFSGWLEVFNVVDSVGDMVVPGAFKKTLSEKKKFPLLWNHSSEPEHIIGVFTAQEEQKGLRVEGRINLEFEDARKLYEKIKWLHQEGISIGLSMGYQVIKDDYKDIANKRVRLLKEVKLYEGSITLFPANELALIEEIKMSETKREWDTAFINDLPDEAFAVIEPAYKRGETEDKRARHLPHHNKSVKDPDDDDTVDLPHLRNALARMNQIKPVTGSISAEELREKAKKHLVAHAKRLGVGDWGEKSIDIEEKINAFWEKYPDGIEISIDELAGLCEKCAESLKKRFPSLVKIRLTKQMPEHLLRGLCQAIGDEPGFFTSCMNFDFGQFDPGDKEAFCAWLHKQCVGKWPREGAALNPEASLGAGKPEKSTSPDKPKDGVEPDVLHSLLRELEEAVSVRKKWTKDLKS